MPVPKLVLTVDDASTIRKLVAFTLGKAGYQVVEAADGNAALAGLQRQPVDLVITDVNMPGMDGIELVRRIRALPSMRAVPVLVLTTESDPESKNRARAAGATGWIVKPFEPGQLLGVVSRVLPITQGAGA